MAAHLRPFAPNSIDVERNLIASPSPTHAISKLLVCIRRRVTPLASTLLVTLVLTLLWMARLVLRAMGLCFVFMDAILGQAARSVHVQISENRT